MAQIEEGVFRSYRNGDRMTDADYNRDREIIRQAINDLDRQVGQFQSDTIVGLVPEIETARGESDSLGIRLGGMDSEIGDLSQLSTTEKGSLTGAVNETVAQLAETMNYLDHIGVDVLRNGAKGDYDSVTKIGTDDSDKLIWAMNFVESKGGGTVFLPHASYYITKTVTVPTSVNLVGNYAKIMVPNRNSFTAIQVLGGNNQRIENITIEEIDHDWGGQKLLSIEGASKGCINKNVVTIGGAGVWITPADGTLAESIKFENCEMSYSSNFGLCLDNSDGVEIVNINAHHNWLDGIKVRKLTKNANIRGGSSCYNGQMVTSDPLGNGNGVDFYGGGDTINVTDLRTEYNQGAGLYIKTGVENIEGNVDFLGYVRDIQLVNCRSSYNTGNGLEVNVGNPASTAEPLVSGVTVLGGTYKENEKGGIYARGRNITITNPICKSNGEHGIQIIDSYDVQVNDPQCIQNGKKTANAYQGLIANRTTRLTINGGGYIGVDETFADTDDYTSNFPGAIRYTMYGVYIGSGCNDVVVNYPVISTVAQGARFYVGMTSGTCLIHLSLFGGYGSVGSTRINNGVREMRVSGNPNEYDTGWEPISKKTATQADSTAVDVASLKADFNALLAKLKSAKLMA